MPWELRILYQSSPSSLSSPTASVTPLQNKQLTLPTFSVTLLIFPCLAVQTIKFPDSFKAATQTKHSRSPPSLCFKDGGSDTEKTDFLTSVVHGFLAANIHAPWARISSAEHVFYLFSSAGVTLKSTLIVLRNRGAVLVSRSASTFDICAIF